MSGRLTSVLDMLATALLAIAAGLFIWTQVESRVLRLRSNPQLEDVKDLSIKASAIRHVKGSGSIALVEFTDYECPFCSEYARRTASAVDKQLVDSGRVQHVVFNFPLERMHPHARPAAEAAECAGRQGHFWEMYARIFSDRSNLESDGFVNSGRVLGLDEAVFTRCLAGEATAQITADIGEASRLRVRATPTFFIGMVRSDGSIDLSKRIGGLVSIADLKHAVDIVSAMRRTVR
jgi:protein-disulfide isomerase